MRPLPAEPARQVVPGPDPRCPEDPHGNFDLRRGKVRFPEAKAELDVEIAEREEHTTRGLMYRKHMPESEGMLFVFPRRDVKSFWMRNTCIPLDMLFIDRDGFIAGIEENVPTLNDRSYRVGCPTTHVLETNAGWARRHGVRPGQTVVFE